MQYYDFHGISNAEMQRHEGEAQLALLESNLDRPSTDEPRAPRWSASRVFAGFRQHFGVLHTPRPAAR